MMIRRTDIDVEAIADYTEAILVSRRAYRHSTTCRRCPARIPHTRKSCDRCQRLVRAANDQVRRDGEAAA